MTRRILKRTMYTYVCEYCLAKYRTRHKPQKYCSRFCSVRGVDRERRKDPGHWSHVVRACLWCKNRFVPPLRFPDQIYCSTTCSNKHKPIANQKTRKQMITKLLSKVSIGENPDDCWEWKKSISASGYGKAYFDGEIDMAHRVFYRTFKEEFHKGQFVLHKCHNRRCVNPQHLKLGNQKDNAQDMVDAHRQLIGERNPGAKLTQESVQAVRELRRKTNLSYNKIAKLVGVSGATIRKVCAYETWQHIDETGVINFDSPVYQGRKRKEKVPGTPRRSYAGSGNPKARLTEKQVEEIRELRKTRNASYGQLMKMFGIGKTTVARICKHEGWKHVE